MKRYRIFILLCDTKALLSAAGAQEKNAKIFQTHIDCVNAFQSNDWSNFLKKSLLKEQNNIVLGSQ